MSMADSLIRSIQTLPPNERKKLLAWAAQEHAAESSQDEKAAVLAELREGPPVLSEGRKNPMGMFAGVGVSITPEDIAETRREMWGNFPRAFPEPQQGIP